MRRDRSRSRSAGRLPSKPGGDRYDPGRHATHHLQSPPWRDDGRGDRRREEGKGTSGGGGGSGQKRGRSRSRERVDKGGRDTARHERHPHHHHHHSSSDRHHHHKSKEEAHRDRRRSDEQQQGKEKERGDRGDRDKTRRKEGGGDGDSSSKKRRSSREEGDRRSRRDDDKKGKEEREEEDAPLELDEEDMRMMMLASGMEEEVDDEERLIAERKRKREEIEALHRQKQQPQPPPSPAQNGSGGSGAVAAAASEEDDDEPPKSPETKRPPSDDDDDEEEDEGPVEVRVHNKPLNLEEAEQDAAIRNGQPENSEEKEFLLDMFSLSPGNAALAAGGLMAKGKGPGGMALASAGAAARGGKDASDTLEDNWDDHDGYYKTLVGEVIAGRYMVLGSIGRGVFSTVLKCQDQHAVEEEGEKGPAVVAIKIIRNNDVMRKAAQRELEILREIAGADPDNRKHCVRLLQHLEHRNHVVLVFESLQMNLRETLRKFGKHVGLNIAAVRTYAKQLLVALRHIGHLGIVHADIKPDNILVSEGFGQLKLCDFGSAFKEDAPDNDPTPYLVSRFYRAPEVILGFEYGRAVDLWSIGCCLYELFTGRVAFPGASNNEMLRLMMEVKGSLPQKVVRRHRAAYEQLQLEPFFEADGRFRQQEADPVSKKLVQRLVHVPPQPTRDLTGVLMKAKAASDDKALVVHLADLLEKIFVLDASKRIDVRDALHHPFLSSTAAAAASSSSSSSASPGGKK